MSIDKIAENVQKEDQVFVNLSADSQEVTELESLCMDCHQQGITKLLLTAIPHFKEIILMAFECPHCGFRNNQIQSAHAISELGVNYRVMVTNARDLNRQVVKSETASVFIPDVEFEVSPSVGELSTIEGYLRKAIEDLMQDQDKRKEVNIEVYQKIESFINALTEFVELRKPFTFVLDDPAGNSYVEDVALPLADESLYVSRYRRTIEQDHKLGMFTQEELNKKDNQQDNENHTDRLLPEQPDVPELMVFHSQCSNCHAEVNANMQIINIPYFKETIIMSSACDKCGFRSNEVKAGGAVSAKGRRITLKVTDTEDLNRDILKSETAELLIPEANLELTCGTLGGRFTTVEGLLVEIRDVLKNQAEFMRGDSAEDHRKLEAFFELLEKTLTKEIDFTIILDDPFSNSYIQNPYAPDSDPQLTIVEYERTFEQNETFGINDMKTENYE